MYDKKLGISDTTDSSGYYNINGIIANPNGYSIEINALVTVLKGIVQGL